MPFSATAVDGCTTDVGAPPSAAAARIGCATDVGTPTKSQRFNVVPSPGYYLLVGRGSNLYPPGLLTGCTTDVGAPEFRRDPHIHTYIHTYIHAGCTTDVGAPTELIK